MLNSSEIFSRIVSSVVSSVLGIAIVLVIPLLKAQFLLGRLNLVVKGNFVALPRNWQSVMAEFSDLKAVCSACQTSEV